MVVVGVEGENRNKLGACQLDHSDIECRQYQTVGFKLLVEE